MGLVVAVFIITAIFVGYHASQEPREETAKMHGAVIGMDVLNNQVTHTIHTHHIKAVFD